MKKIKNTLKITLLLLLAICTLAGCGNSVATLTPAPMPEYPDVDGSSGYSVSGNATDTNGNPLEGVQMQIGKKLFAVTDSNGHYKISGLEGENKIIPFFYNYKFDNAEFTVKSESKVDISGTNSAKYMIDFATTSNSTYKTPIYGVTYRVNGKDYSADNYKEAFAENLTGKVTVTPSKAGFSFMPETLDVYAGTTAQFTAVPNSDRYSVSGNIDISSLSEDEMVQTVQMYVDGALATTSYVDFVYSPDGDYKQVMKYQIDGLDPNKSGGHNITYKINGGESMQRVNVTAPTKTADFKYFVTKTVDVKLDISIFDIDVNTLPDGYALDYDIKVYDENGEFVKKYSGRDITEEDVVIWRGAVLEIEGMLIDSTGGGSDEFIRSIKESKTISEADMRKDYAGSHYKIRTSLRTYRPD